MLAWKNCQYARSNKVAKLNPSKNQILVENSLGSKFVALGDNYLEDVNGRSNKVTKPNLSKNQILIENSLQFKFVVLGDNYLEDVIEPTMKLIKEINMT